MCKLLALTLEDRGYGAWLDQEVAEITPEAMFEGVQASHLYTLYLSPGALARPFVVFEMCSGDSHLEFMYT